MKIRLKGTQNKQMQPWERVKQRFYQVKRKGSRREERGRGKEELREEGKEREGRKEGKRKEDI